MWICSCKAENSLTLPCCSVCGGEMPQSERNRIYKEQLRIAQKKQREMLMRFFKNLLRLGLYKLGIEEKSFSGVVAIVVEAVRDVFQKYKKGIITVAVAFFVIFGIRGIFNMENQYILQYTHREDSAKRQAFTEHITKKLETVPKAIEYMRDNPSNPTNDEYKIRVEEKLQILRDNFETAKSTALEFVEETIEELKK